MLTADQYYRFAVGRTLDKVLNELEKDPRRVWSADCVFFLAMYWDRQPANRDRLAALINSGQLRLTSSGVTTQDTLLPTTESILRDFLIGQEWLRTRGMVQEPRLAYFPDSFGHSPALPTLLQASGFDRALVTRIDGAFFAGSDWELPGRFPRRGSSAEVLTRAGSADFVWRDQAGSEVLAHWHPFTYGQGDMLASVGVVRFMSVPSFVPDRSARRVAARIERYAARLEPLARTPYVLCPIGLDFINPIRDLLELIDRYNEERYPETGLWVTNAGADDYLDLISEHRDDLPVLEFDPNPYWTGFYSSRPELKRSQRRLVDELLATEAEAVAAGPLTATRAAADLAEPWWKAVIGNHHDFVTGTSPDRVVRKEQEPWMRSALAEAERVASGLEVRPADEPSAATIEDPATYEWVVDMLKVTSGALNATIDPAQGGCITEIALNGRTVLSGRGADLVAYDDAGGLWRMGGEYRGGHFNRIDSASDHRARVTVQTSDSGEVFVIVFVELDGRTCERRYRFGPGAHPVVIETRCFAGDRRTVTLALPTDATDATVTMDQPGGLVTRPAQRHFDPTFWPVSTWMTVDRDSEGGPPHVALSVEMTRAVATRPDGTVEVIVARNANKEKAWSVVPILACPAKGHEPGETEATIGLWWPDATAPAELYATALAVSADPARARLEAAVARVVTIHPAVGGERQPAVDVLSLKAASRGEGVVLRLIARSDTGAPQLRLRTEAAIASASICDARERDIECLDVRSHDEGSEVTVALDGPVVSVRLVLTSWED